MLQSLRVPFMRRLFMRRTSFLVSLTLACVLVTGGDGLTAGSLRRPDLQQALDRLVRGFNGRVGACIRDAAGAVCVNGGQRFSLQSVMKLMVGIAVMDAVDRQGWKLDDEVIVRKQDLSIGVQPIARLVTGDGYRTTIDDLVRRAIVDSDSAATDILIARLGGAQTVQAVLARHDLPGVRVDRDERRLQTDTIGLTWKPEFVDTRVLAHAVAAVPAARRAAAFRAYQKDVRDTATPMGMVVLLHALAEGKLVSAAGTKRLLEIMEQTVTFPDRLKAGVPAGWTLGHKTGTSSTWEKVTAATNDVGILKAPDGGTVSIAVFIGDARASAIARASMIASIARAATTHYQ